MAGLYISTCVWGKGVVQRTNHLRQGERGFTLQSSRNGRLSLTVTVFNQLDHIPAILLLLKTRLFLQERRPKPSPVLIEVLSLATDGRPG